MRPAFCIPILTNLHATLGDGAGLANTGRIIGDFLCHPVARNITQKY